MNETPKTGKEASPTNFSATTAGSLGNTPGDTSSDTLGNPKGSVQSLIGDINLVQSQLRELLGKRTLLVRELMKQFSSAESDTAVTKMLASDAASLQLLLSTNSGPLSDDALFHLFTEIQAASRAPAAEVVVAYLGPEGTFTQAAVYKHFGDNAKSQSFTTIDDVFRAVEAGECQFGVAPVENSVEGAVNRTLDCLTESSVHICGEVRLRIEHNLMSQAADLDAIKSVHAHPQALAQCRQWLDKHLPGVAQETAASNAAAARLAVTESGVAAIAGDTAAAIYGLPMLYQNIEDDPSNTTRFVVIGSHEMPATGSDATSLLVSAPHRPGGLRKMLEPFENAGVSMTRIESRPAKKALWNYVFFIDVSGHKDDGDLAPALDALSRETRFFRVLGSYPAAVG